MSKYVAAQPYPWPYDGDLRPENTALVIIDMQTDFCGKGGYIDGLGYDLSNARATIDPIRRVLARFRAGQYHVIHTREGHRQDLSDLPANKRWRSRVLQNGGAGQPGIRYPGPRRRAPLRRAPRRGIIPPPAPQ